jgi:diguanylate cyclase (GGDEF)-like protein
MIIEIIEEKISENKNIKFGIVMIDIDDFKKINDLYGHQFGDKVLINTSDIITANVSKEGIVARYGGEEIIIYLSDVGNEAKRTGKNKVVSG